MSNEQLLQALATLTTEQLEAIEKMVEQLNAHYSQDKYRHGITMCLAWSAAA